MTERLLEIDESNRHDHSKLVDTDECLYWLEYTAGQRWDYGRGNQLISNFKKKPGIAGPAEMRHKARAISEAAAFYSNAISESWRTGATFVPMPPSKVIGHPQHDDRLLQMCLKIAGVPPAHVKELIVQTESLEVPAHKAGANRPSVRDLLKVWRIDEQLAEPLPNRIALMDDMLTAGVHFRAAHQLLSLRFPQARIVGFFLARRALPKAADDFDEIDPDWEV